MARTLGPRPHSTPAPARTGFSLIEMLVVLLILTVVISIVVPALGHFRNAARKSATQSLMASLATAAGQFKMSQSRVPGYFSPRDMGSPENGPGQAGTGLTGSENLMLDLFGGPTQETTPAAMDPCAENGIIEVGPTSAAKTNVDLGRMGSATGGATGQVNKGYFRPDPKFFIRQCKPGQRAEAPTPNSAAMPVLVDAWGSPILAWVRDDLPAAADRFGSVSSTTRALFYVNSNAAFLGATSLGKLARDQTSLENGSMLGGLGGAAANSLRGFLANPAFPNEARGSIIFHSAGPDGVYIGREERGGKRAGAVGQANASLAAGNHLDDGSFNDFIVKAD